jgi:hypothetical protein
MNPEYSAPWSQESPRLLAHGLDDLQGLKGQCTEDQHNLRNQAFDAAESFARRAHPQGVMAPVRETFQNRNLPRKLKTARVDLEVKAGLAFI